MTDRATLISDLDTFTQAYVECALWSSTESDEDGTMGEPLDRNHTADDIATETLAEMVKDCKDFLDTGDNTCIRDLISGSEEQAGHDFWLTRNHHGAGFWDGDWSTPMEAELADGTWGPDPQYPTLGHYLTTMSHACGSYDLYIGDDGLIHGQ